MVTPPDPKRLCWIIGAVSLPEAPAVEAPSFHELRQPLLAEGKGTLSEPGEHCPKMDRQPRAFRRSCWV